jgi:hypothetical protein
MARRTCTDCAATSPETQTQYTLIARHGWRVIRARGVGQEGIEWRCPTCWAAYKSRQPPAAKTAHTSKPPVRARKELVEAGKMFDRALQALTSKPPGKTR